MKRIQLGSLLLAILLVLTMLAGCAGGAEKASVMATADYSGLMEGVIQVEFQVSADIPSVTVTADLIKADGSCAKSWTATADLKQGGNTVPVSVDKELVADYGDRFVLSYTMQDGEKTQFSQRVLDMELFAKLNRYLAGLSAEPVEASGIDKGYYARVTAQCLAEYQRSNDLRSATVNSLESNLQSYSRVLCSMAVLVDYGAAYDLSAWAEEYETDLFADYDAFKKLFDQMMNTGCAAAAFEYAGKDVENFSVKELAIAYCLAKEHYPEASVAAWAASLSQVVPDFSYFSHSDQATNRNGYVIGGEQLRAWLGLADQNAVNDLIDSSLGRQFSHFDENGMYRDNYGSGARELNPSLYDLTTRAQLQLVLGYGYQGEKAEKLDALLQKGGLMTLFTTSVNGELPYGGRSNQYLFNAALISANCEYEAGRYAALGDTVTAGAYKRTAHLAIASVADYLAANKHIMNYYVDSKVGTEDYGNYDKYMVTMSSFLAIAYLFADDTIAEGIAPMEAGGYVLETSEVFRSVCANAGGYSIQILTDADTHYDSVGLGRIQKEGVYSALALSMSMSKTPAYTMPAGTKADAVSLCPRWWNGNKEYCLADIISLRHELEVLREDAEAVEFVITYEGKGKFKGISALEEHYLLTAEGLTVTVTVTDPTENRIGYMVPLLVSNGDGDFAGQTEIQTTDTGFTVFLNGQTYTVTSDADLVSKDETLYGNRNGAYCVGLLEKAGNTITIKFRLD